MDRRIDLTLNGDFTHWTQETEIIAQEDFSSFLDEMALRKNMSLEEYNKLTRIEGFFGRRRHYTEAMEVFMESDEDFLAKMSGQCCRCGQPVLPWRKKDGLCPECKNKLDREYGFGRFFEGWTFAFGNNDDRGQELFSLR